MAFTQIYVNLPVTDLETSKKMYTAMGGTINPDFTGDTSAQVVFADAVVVQLMTRETFATFTKRDIADGPIEVINALAVGSREEVDRLADAALAAGATEPREAQDMGWLYNRAIDDPDGHCWELLAYDPAAMGDGSATAQG
ncbi:MULTISPECIES: VOC family protein [Nocardia]|uniref:VOC family protein n=1 Tax=Nocardia TaxID=1817 RepID=UPI0007EAD0AB|nr:MULTISPECIES: VOC family protein [Nocardia]MBF6278133.1 lactoylglutathione lyase [Nocardia nova]OBA56172.1 lactoylglutathione lyase [Nocardia sp. 852002-51101_SCH5132738]OBB36193.1 lactoylglutathione lyase [Nocardia sp. 852002-51244_SCH5132740]OBF68857.1 lactoylglutathione lyase [Mycobacterium sp. 852002-51759_SCH5129042]